jgi:hypothetical protein
MQTANGHELKELLPSNLIGRQKQIVRMPRTPRVEKRVLECFGSRRALKFFGIRLLR